MAAGRQYAAPSPNALSPTNGNASMTPYGRGPSPASMSSPAGYHAQPPPQRQQLGQQYQPSLALAPASSAPSSSSSSAHRNAGPPGSLPPGTMVRIGPYTVTVQRYLSQGGFATVYLCQTDRPVLIPSDDGTDRSETQHVLKRIVVPDKETLAEVRREVEVHKLLRHDPAVVHFLEASALSLPPPQTGYEVYILMEFCSGGGLLDLLNTRLRNRLSEPEILQIFADICKGVAAMHHLDPPVAHRDLKIENILLSAPPASAVSKGRGRTVYKLCDFGSAKPILSRRAPRSMDELKRLEQDLNKSTTLPYRPPEMVDVYQRRVIDEKADIWALGVLLYKLCYYTTPFEENGGGVLAILNVKYRFPSSPPYSDRIKGLVASLLTDPSTRRPSIDQLLIQVHKLLGTRPPSSAVHYAQLTQSGKQAQALPRPMDSQSHSRTDRRALDDDMLVKVARQRAQGHDMNTSTSSSGRSTASSASNRPLSMVGPPSQHRPLYEKGVPNSISRNGSTDLLSFRPPSAQSNGRDTSDSEALMKLEGVTPMRRGRPAPASNSPGPGGAPTPPRKDPAPVGKLDMKRWTTAGPPTAVPSSSAPASPRKQTSPLRATPEGKVGTLIEGFGDSFEPTAADLPPPSNATSQGPIFPSKVDAHKETASSLKAPADATPVNLSPSLPGLQGIPSTLSPLSQPEPEKATLSTKERIASYQSRSSLGSGDDSADGRFPSLEELDRRYPRPVERPPPPTTSKPVVSSSTRPALEGVSKGRMADIATKFGGSSAGSIAVEGSKQGRPTPTLPPRTAKAKDWLSSSSTSSSSQPPKADLRLSPTHERLNSFGPASPLTPGTESLLSKLEATAEPTGSSALANGLSHDSAAREKETDESSDEDEGPESLETGTSARNRWEKPQVSPSVTGRDGTTVAPENKSKPELPKAPKPLVDFDSAPPSRSQTVDKPEHLDLQKASISSISPQPQARGTEQPSPSKDGTALPQTTAASRAPAWDWDTDATDDAEMRALPRPQLHARLSSDARGGSLGRLVDIDDEENQDQQREERSLAGQRALDDFLAGGPTTPLEDEAELPAPEPTLKHQSEPDRHSSTDTAYSATAGLPSRERKQLGKVYAEANTSPFPSSSPVPSASASVEPSVDVPARRSVVSSPSAASPSPEPAAMTQEEGESVGGYKTYARGTAQSMASKWESIGAIGSGKRPSFSSSSAGGGGGPPVKPSAASKPASPSSVGGAAASGRFAGPQIIQPKPIPIASRPRPSVPPKAASLKPWEREAAEHAEVSQRGYIRPHKMLIPSSTSSSSGAEEVKESRDSHESETAAASGTDVEGEAEPGTDGSDTHRYRSVANLIDRWQANAKSQQPERGWGEIGAGGGGASGKVQGAEV